MLNFKEELSKLSLNQDNCVVVGSGILNELGIRESNDIDVVVRKDIFQKMKEENNYKVVQKPFSVSLLTNGVVEFSDRLYIYNENIREELTYEDLMKESSVINGLRYISLECLLEIKELRKRDKDIPDIELIKKYLERNK